MSPKSPLTSEVLEAEQRVWEAVVRKDGIALGELFSDDYLEITLDGKRIVRAEVVEQSPVVDEITGYAIDSEKVVALNADTAILSYHLTLQGRCRGVEISPVDRWATSVWSRQNGVWKCCLFQQSQYAPETSDALRKGHT
ncbi:DUF4440 domain-containing protein [bacterium]|nr:DUF4440 domain-containing protein [bacterium]